MSIAETMIPPQAPPPSPPKPYTFSRFFGSVASASGWRSASASS